MFIAILIAATIIALVLIFRDDHDKSYDKRGDLTRLYRPESKPTVITRSEPVKQEPVDKTAVQKPPVPERNLSWSFLSSLEYDDLIIGDTLETEITGMRYYCTLADAGPVNGTVRPEPDNPHDPRAHVVIRSDGKKMGYIPRYALSDYEDFNEDNLVCPFAGMVKVDPNGYIHADILVALPVSPEYVKEELTDYIENR